MAEQLLSSLVRLCSDLCRRQMGFTSHLSAAKIKSHFRSISLLRSPSRRFWIWSVHGEIGLRLELIESYGRAIAGDNHAGRRGGRLIAVAGLKRLLLRLIERGRIPRSRPRSLEAHGQSLVLAFLSEPLIGAPGVDAES